MMPDVEDQEEKDPIGLCVVKIMPVYFFALHFLIVCKGFPQAIPVEILLHHL